MGLGTNVVTLLTFSQYCPVNEIRKVASLQCRSFSVKSQTGAEVAKK